MRGANQSRKKENDYAILHISSHCELQSNNTRPEHIDAEHRFAFDVGQLFALGVSLNFEND